MYLYMHKNGQIITKIDRVVDAYDTNGAEDYFASDFVKMWSHVDDVEYATNKEAVLRKFREDYEECVRSGSISDPRMLAELRVRQKREQRTKECGEYELDNWGAYE